MSSNRKEQTEEDQDEPLEGGGVGSKRKFTRACDICRRRKHRCDGPEKGPGDRCTNCVTGTLSCTYVESSKRRATPKGYVETLENRLARMTELLAQARPDFDPTTELGELPTADNFSNRRPAILPKGDSSTPNKSQLPYIPQSSSSSSSSEQQQSYPLRPTHTELERSIASRQPYNPLSTQFPPITLPSLSEGHHHALDYQVLTQSSSPLNPILPGPSSASFPSSIHRAPSSYASASSSVRDETPVSQSELLQKGKDEDEDEFLRKFVKLNRPDELIFRSFFGKSSFLPLLWSGIGFKYGTNAARYKEESCLHPAAPQLSLWQTPIWETTPDPTAAPSWIGGRTREYEALMSPNPFHSWPDRDLANDLIEGYFGAPNEYVPLLQKAHFLRQYASQLYLSDHGFARLCFLVFAVGSMHSEDIRTRFPLQDPIFAEVKSAGWIYYHAYRKLAKSPLAPTDLYDLQTTVLLVSFLRVQSSQPRACWSIVGSGLRFAVDVGAHRGGTQRSADPAENELFRRAFWCLQVQDNEFASLLGRPPNLEEANFDATLELDANFWMDGEVLEPHGQPSRLQAFVLEVQLSMILSRVSAQIYGIKPRTNGVTSQELVKDFDDQLREWLESVPPHLRWNISTPNSLDFRLSSLLALSYQVVVTLVHRPFLPSPQHPISTSPTSMASTFEAALASVGIIQSVFDRNLPLPPGTYFAANSNALILLISIWGGTSTQGSVEPGVAMEAVEQSIHILEDASKSYSGVGRTIASSSVLAAVLAAPRIDYLAESVARRQAREQKVALAEALQESYRNASSARSPHSSNEPSHSISSNFHQQNSHLDSSLSQTPSHLNSSHLPLDDQMPFDSRFFGTVFPDFFTADDPAMTLFPSSSEGQFPPENFFFPQGEASNSGGWSNGVDPRAGGRVGREGQGSFGAGWEGR